MHEARTSEWKLGSTVAEQAIVGSLSIGVDIGGTNFRAAVVDSSGAILHVQQLPTPASVHALEQALENVIGELIAQFPAVASVGLAVAGFVDEAQQGVRFAPHLPWRNQEIVPKLSQRLGLPVVLEHDANAAALGEYHFGAAQGVNNWVLFALGTGIGGALMINGQIYRGAFGAAPEFGHLTVVPEGRCCPCGKRGCLERYCSGSALPLTAYDLLAERKFPTSQLAQQFADRPEGLTGRAVVEAAQQGDTLGVAAVQDMVRWLGQGLALVHDVFDPELIVIGGGLSTIAQDLLPDATAIMERSIVGAGHRPVARVVPAALSGDAGMIGVATLARHRA